ncbi:MAG: amidohydrolase family protein [Acidimicrobiia bacterium]
MADVIEQAGGRYPVISADCHAGGSHAQYREYLDPQYRDEFDAWRGGYRNPFDDLGDRRRFRNWDDDMRNEQQEADGVIGEVVYPNTVPPFFPSFVLFAGPPKPEEYELRHAGVRAHNRWLADFCSRAPERRAGVGQIFLNDVDDAIEDVKWIKEHGLRGGILLPNVAPDVKWVKPINDPVYDPLWEVIQDLDVVVNVHGGTGLPNYGGYDTDMLFYINEVFFYSQRPLVHMILGGVFERFPRLRFVLAEIGCHWVPGVLDQMDRIIEQIRTHGASGEMRYPDACRLPKLASEYFQQNCSMAVSMPVHSDVAAIETIGIDKFMWGSDYPHDEGTYPFTREHLRQIFPAFTPAELTQVLTTNAARMYDFDLDALAPLAAQYGPTVDELAVPLDQLPDEPNEALLRGIGIGMRV